MLNYERQRMQHDSPCAKMLSKNEESLAMAYVPWQHFNNVYEPDKAILCGTIFPELNKPFYGRKGACL